MTESLVKAMLELHSSPLTSSCLRRTKLTINGLASGYTTGALFVGNVAHAALRWMHEKDRWDACETAIVNGAVIAEKQADDDNRPLSEAVVASKEEHLDTARKLVQAYADKCRLPDGSRLIGCELPIRASWEVDGEPFEFASHLDMLWRRPNGTLVVRDWKSGDDSPSAMYLSRNMQLGAYHLAVGEGEVCVSGEWLAFDAYPSCEWVHLRNLLPYGRATTTKDDDGNIVKFEKGESRPLRSALIDIEYNDRGRQAIRDEMALRVRMMRAGFWPTNPDPEGCRHCDVKPHCPAFDYPRGNT